jgi:hypothetical protein
MYTWKCHREIPYVAILNKNVIFFFFCTKSENRRAEQFWLEVLVPVRWGGDGERYKEVNIVQMLCMYICK